MIQKKKKLPSLGNYRDMLTLRLAKDSQLCADYLNGTVSDEHPGVFLLALHDVIEAHGGLKTIAPKTGISLNKLTSIFDEKEELGIVSLTKIIHSLGWQISIQASEIKPEQKKTKKRALSTIPKKPVKKRTIPSRIIPANNDELGIPVHRSAKKN